MTKCEDTYTELRISAQMALLGEVVPAVRGVAVDWGGTAIPMYFYNDGGISSELKDDFHSIGGEVVSFFSDASIEEKIVRLDYPAEFPPHKFWVYRRKES